MMEIAVDVPKDSALKNYRLPLLLLLILVILAALVLATAVPQEDTAN